MSNEKLYDLSFLNKISGGDQSFIREMIVTFLEAAPEYLQKADEYSNQKKYEALSRETHKFIPGVSFLGIKYLEKELMLLEEYTKKIIELDKVPDLVKEITIKIENLMKEFSKDFDINLN